MLAEFSSLVLMDTMLCQVVVPGEHGLVVIAKFCSEFFGHVDRAMLATGTSDRNSQIATVRVFEAGDPAIEKTDDVVKHRNKIFLFAQIVYDFLVQSCQPAQVGAPIGVW
jgi:hypothetical protein